MSYVIYSKFLTLPAKTKKATATYRGLNAS